jgi:hypothetical protein
MNNKNIASLGLRRKCQKFFIKKVFLKKYLVKSCHSISKLFFVPRYNNFFVLILLKRNKYAFSQRIKACVPEPPARIIPLILLNTL